MTINNILASFDQRNPRFLFEFQQGATYWRYSNGVDTSFNGADFPASIVALAKLTRSVTEATGQAEITMPSDDPVVQIFDAFLPVEPVTCTVYNLELNDPDSQSRIILSGQVVGVDDNDDSTSVVRVKPIYQATSRSVPWELQQATCILPLYGIRCKANPELFKTTVIGLAAMDGSSITAGAFANADPTWFNAGYIKCRESRETRFILTQNPGGLLYIAYPFNQSKITDTYDAYAGCMKTGAICQGKFNNKRRFLGHEHIPVTNAFKTSLKN